MKGLIMPIDWTKNPPREELAELVRETLDVNEVSTDVAEAVVDTVLHNFVIARIKPYTGFIDVAQDRGGYVVVLGNERWFVNERDLGDLSFNAQDSLDHVADTIAKQRAAIRAARAEQAKRRGSR